MSRGRGLEPRGRGGDGVQILAGRGGYGAISGGSGRGRKLPPVQASIFSACSFHNYFHGHFTKQAGNYNNNLRNDKIAWKMLSSLTYIQRLVKARFVKNTRHQQQKKVIRTKTKDQ